ncbi:methylase involved in ubiquinone/menaquinone biosynthesis [Halosimplex carlsbadense 2-9-1]|uniref:Methylase involved in ubiquinone/menaquinone biosynthesis n=1 Tax=Halosimplex carlsbadense 2-9-1 TaxID=797114 RepID=M0CCD4_9EURY|nr:class I SAM-dependent methyltransferase [Halosimplex carlsbadense]ELZ20308.1 methylase involved in ubiquinone/menaquinone biosynthesis [Halosimplex carlsbadense 2-9-1]
MKGQEWYQQETVVESYEDKRFSRGGGRLTDRLEKEAVGEALAPVEGRKILEIACGTGRFSVMLAQQGADVVGLDISAPMLGEGRRKARQAGVDDHLEFLRGDAARLPFPDDHFDSVFAIRFFHLVDEPKRYLRELARVSSDQVVFETYNRFSGRSLYNWALPMGSRLYSRREVDGMLAAADLRLTDETHEFVVPFGLYRKLPGGVAKAFRKLEEGIDRTPLGDSLASISYWSATVE